ncbi:MAG: CopG family transcriptional regulator [Anaerolineae bacterium]
MKTLRERPLQIYLRPDQDQALRRLASQQQVSMAALIRQGIDRLLAEIPVEQDPALKLIGLGSSGLGDLAENHDKYIVEAILKHSGQDIKSKRKRGPRKA